MKNEVVIKRPNHCKDLRGTVMRSNVLMKVAITLIIFNNRTCAEMKYYADFQLIVLTALVEIGMSLLDFLQKPLPKFQNHRFRKKSLY